jgi:hypothetical protein
MEIGKENATVKKARVEEPLLLPPNVQVKQEVGVVATAAEGDTRKEVDIIKFDETLLHCPVCSDRLRPPVFLVSLHAD